MKTELHYYDVFPKVFAAGVETTVTVKPLGDHAAFGEPENLSLAVFGLEDGDPHDYPDRKNGVEIPFEFDGTVKFTCVFPKEQQYFLRFTDKNSGKRLAQLSVYALGADLVGRYPFIGDLHMHTCRSDGSEAPAVVSANYRKRGYDFLAITDHNRYYPSLEAIDAYKGVPIEFTIVPGEEVHMPKEAGLINDVHIVNFGGNYSVNAIVEGVQTNEVGKAKKYRSYKGSPCPEVITKEKFQKEVLDLAGELDAPEGIEPFAYACCVWVFNNIKKAGGLGIFCHPYWISNVYQVPETLTDYILKTRPFDAFEVLGGETYYEQNGFQAQKYYENRANGINYPIVGSSDSHRSVNNPKACVASTMVFSPANKKDAIIKSIKDYYSVAIDGISEEFRLTGDLRLSRYACFLLEEFFPLHDDLCREEGRAMKDYVCGVEGAKETLKFINGRMKRQREKYFSF